MVKKIAVGIDTKDIWNRIPDITLGGYHEY